MLCTVTVYYAVASVPARAHYSEGPLLRSAIPKVHCADTCYRANVWVKVRVRIRVRVSLRVRLRFSGNSRLSE